MWLWLKVVVTAPVPQILQLGGGVQTRIQKQPQLLQQLEKVDLSTAFLRQLHIFPTIFLSFGFNKSNLRTFAQTLSLHICQYVEYEQPLDPGGVLNPVCAWDVLQRTS